jgi:hypothetical protein
VPVRVAAGGGGAGGSAPRRGLGLQCLCGPPRCGGMFFSQSLNIKAYTEYYWKKFEFV